MPTLPFAVIPTPLGTVTSGNELAAKPASHLGEFKAPGMTWRSAGTANLWARGDFGAFHTVSFMSLLSANAQPGTTIRLRLSNTGPSVDGVAQYDSGVLPFISPAITRPDGLYHCHVELPPSGYKWWRIDIGGHSGDFEAAALVLGEKRTPSNFYSPVWQFGIQDLGEIEIGRFGIVDEQSGLIYRTASLKFGWLSEADYELLFRPLVEQLGRRGVAYWCLDPTANAYRQAKSYFGWLRDPPIATGGIIPGRYEQEFQLLSMI